MRNLILITALALTTSDTFAATPVQQVENYVKSTCFAVSETASVDSAPVSFGTYYFYIDPSQSYPTRDELVQIYGSRYFEFLKACTNSDHAGLVHRATTEYVSVSSQGLRPVGTACRSNSQCQSNSCNSLAGSCQ